MAQIESHDNHGPSPLPFRAIQYLGSKVRLASQIEQLVGGLISEGSSVVCDLFSGSGVVSQHLAHRYDIVACDIQQYSAVIAQAVVETCDFSPADADKFIVSLTNSERLLQLRKIYAPLIEFEENCLARAEEGNPEALLVFSEHASEYVYENDPHSEDLPHLLRECFDAVDRNRRRENTNLPLITHYYGGVYFSYSQAIELDSILESIEPCDSRNSTEALKLAALLSTASAIVNTVGKHFAQPMKLRKRDGGAKALQLQRTAKDKSYDTIDQYRQSLLAYLEARPNRVGSHDVICADYRELLADPPRRFGCVYADPPYTIDHYSRFYHVLETIARRDYPVLDRMKKKGKMQTMRGLYRAGRHQSPFCVPSEVDNAFIELFAGIRRWQAPLVLSYSPYNPGNNDRPRLMTLDKIWRLASDYYPRVEIVEAEPHSHRRLHSTKKNIDPINHAECFVLCSFE